MLSPYFKLRASAVALVLLCIAGPFALAGSPRVVATTGMLADGARQLAADFATVDGLMAEGIDPHLYRPTRADLVMLTRADIIFYNGMHLEGRMGDVLARLKRRDKAVHAIAEEVFAALKREPLADDDEGDADDPHIWMDVELWRQSIACMAERLSQRFPQQAKTIQTNQARYDAELMLLAKYAQEVLSSIPEGSRVLVTAHDAFGYLGAAHDIEVHGIQGISTESEAGLRDIVELIDFIVAREIPAIFVETSVADKNVRALIEGARSRGHPLHIGGELFSDAMGPSGHWTGTYTGMIDHNVTTIANALGGSAPKGGFREWRKKRQ